jgi:hypothetical protein
VRLAPLLLFILACGPDTRPSGGPLAHGISASGHYALDVFTNPQPPVRGQISARLSLTRADGQVVRGMNLEITPWMPEHGHGSSVMPSVVEAEDGDYDVNDLYLPMEGTWQLRTAVDDSRDDEIDVTIEVR